MPPAAPRPGHPTLRDVADAAGVAVSTVSRALSDPTRVNERTRERILAAAAELEYRRSGPSGRRETNAVALVVPDVKNPFYAEILAGLGSQLRGAGYLQILIDTEESNDLEIESLERIRSVVDGVVVIASRAPNDDLRRVAEQTPLVTINRPITDIPGVVVDASIGLTEAVEHLASLGHRRLCYVAGPANSWPDRHRRSAVLAAAERLGIEVEIIGPMRPTRAAGLAAADAIAHSGATACLAYNDLLALGIIARFAERGIRVPEEISVVGCDDIFGADFCDPPLTTIGADLEMTGREAAKALIALLRPGLYRGNDITAVPTQLIVRRSSGSVPQGAPPREQGRPARATS